MISDTAMEIKQLGRLLSQSPDHLLNVLFNSKVINEGEYHRLKLEMAMNPIGELIHEARIAAGFGLREFAEKIGMQPSRLAELEHLGLSATGTGVHSKEISSIASNLASIRVEKNKARESAQTKSTHSSSYSPLPCGDCGGTVETGHQRLCATELEALDRHRNKPIPAGA